MRKLAALAAIFACLAGATAGAADTGPTPKFNRTIFIVNRSTLVSDQELADQIPAYQAEADAFGKYWGGSYHLMLTGAAPARSWVIYVEDDADVAGAAGYHSMTKSGIPYAKAFVNQSPGDLSVTISHEEVEMMADPRIDRGALVGKLWYLVEIADPVEGDADAWTSSGVQLSDFVFPTWYSGSTVRSRYDYVGHDRKALTLRPGGYVSWWTPTGWKQAYARNRRIARFRAIR